MKEIIYLDTGVLHSFMAQHNDGLPTITNNENEEKIHDAAEKTKGHSSQSAIEAALKTGSFEIPLFFKTPEGEIKGTFKPGEHASDKSIMSQTETGKEIISKQLHDNALIQFEKIMSEQQSLFNVNNNDLEGKLIKHTSEFKIIDFRYLKKIIQSDKLVRFMSATAEEKVKEFKEEVEDTTNGKEKAHKKTLLKSMESKLKEEKKKMENQFNFVEDTLDYLNAILPTGAFILMGNTIVPIKDEYLREKASELSFKYGDSTLEITMIGKVTSVVRDTEMPDLKLNSTFFDFPKIINTVLSPLDVIHKGNLIVSPIAIYFE